MTANELIKINKEYAENLARTKKRTVRWIALEDLISEAYHGLVDAANKYIKKEETRNFKTYAYYRIMGAMNDYLRRESLIKKRVKYKEVESIYYPLEWSILTDVLSPQGLEIVNQYYLQGESKAEISKKTGLPEKLLSNRLSLYKKQILDACHA